jgi:hypothetical protein
VTVELGDGSYQARAVVTTGEERERLYRLVSDGTSAYEKTPTGYSRSSSSKAFPPPPDRLIRDPVSVVSAAGAFV